MIRWIVLSLMIAASAVAQDPTVERKWIVEGLGGLKNVGGFMLADDKPEIKLNDVALVTIKTQVPVVDLECIDASKNEFDVSQISSETGPTETTTQFLIDASGKVKLKVLQGGIVDGKLVFLKKVLNVDLGGTPDEPDVPPPPPPPPPTTCDSKTNTNFDSLAKRACVWATGVSPVGRARRADLAKAYLDASEGLANGRHLTINAASDELLRRRAEILNSDELLTAWADWITKANVELAKHWKDDTTNTAKRTLAVQFYRSLGEGLQ